MTAHKIYGPRGIARHSLFRRDLPEAIRAEVCKTFLLQSLAFSRYILAAPRIARSSDSVAPEVKTISLSEAPIAAAIWWRASSTAASAFQPNTRLHEAAGGPIGTRVGGSKASAQEA